MVFDTREFETKVALKKALDALYKEHFDLHDVRMISHNHEIIVYGKYTALTD